MNAEDVLAVIGDEQTQGYDRRLANVARVHLRRGSS